MNRLILIGNGFDLAHGLETGYNDFIRWYIKECFTSAIEDTYSDELIEISQTTHFGMVSMTKETIDDLVERSYTTNFDNLEKLGSQLYRLGFQSTLQPFTVTIKSALLRSLLDNCSYTRWVDIESEFYEQLKLILTNPRSTFGRDSTEAKERELKSLNQSLKFIIAKLEIYLESLTSPTFDERYMDDILTSNILENDVHIAKNEVARAMLSFNEEPEKTYILNFNYTNTLKEYTQRFSRYSEKPLPTINFIHGQLGDRENPLIFGFGDELDDAYLTMEHEKAKGYFEHIKSFWYFRTSNYHDLIRFLDSQPFQAYILGHSCGLSDRTMLHMIFEHTNCKSIKIYYYGDKENNNYTNVTYDIARHFKDKAEMRNKIVPLSRSSAMPQA